jgi:Protein of unknown function (DUF2877)
MELPLPWQKRRSESLSMLSVLTLPRQAGPPQPGAYPRLHATSIGCEVLRAGETGQVDAIFERACNISTESGRLVALLGRQAGNVAHGVQLACDRVSGHGLQRGMLVSIKPSRIIFGRESLTVDLSTSRIWTPDLRLGMWRGTARSRHALMHVREVVTESAPRSGSEFLAVSLGLTKIETPLAVRIQPILPQLMVATRSHDSRAALNLLSQLIGLGPGLTPAGDDFIVGWLAGLALSAQTAAQIAFLDAMCRGVESLAHATTFVSRQHLRDACALMFSERLSDLSVAIALGETRSVLAARVVAQIAVGASSGADAAGGLISALSDFAQ